MMVTLAVAAVAGAAIYRYALKRRMAYAPLLSIPDANQLPLLRLQPKISWCKYLENVDDLGMRLAEQFAAAQNITALSFDVLRQKFSTTELTYGRYEKTISESNVVLTDNLAKVIPLLEALDALADEKSTNQQALRDRIQNLLSSNQNLLDKLNELIANLSDIKNLTGPDQKTADFLLDNLKTMTERAKLY